MGGWECWRCVGDGRVGMESIDEKTFARSLTSCETIGRKV